MFERFSPKVLAILILALLVVCSVVAPVSAAPVKNVVHVVQWGETLYSIARSYGVNMWSIARVNGITNLNRIYAGQRLVIPTGWAGGWGYTGTVHTVQWGETLYRIARNYGVYMWAIAHANNIANPNYIYAGQRLVIP